MAALLPTLNAQAVLTVNEPEVSVPFDQRQQVFSSLLQGAAISDASVALAKTGMLQSGSLTNALRTTATVRRAQTVRPSMDCASKSSIQRRSLANTAERRRH